VGIEQYGEPNTFTLTLCRRRGNPRAFRFQFLERFNHILNIETEACRPAYCSLLSGLCLACPWRIPEIRRRWVSDTVRDSAAATDMNHNLTAYAFLPNIRAVLPSPNAHVAD